MKRIFNKRLSAIMGILALVMLVSMLPQTHADVVSLNEPARPAAKGEFFVPGRLLVKFKPGLAKSRARNLISMMGSRASRELGRTGVHVVELPEGLDERFFMEAYRSQPEVEFAELDMVLPPDEMLPDDPTYPNEWHLPKIESPSAWTMTTGNDSVTIAILDTGVDPNHPDLAGKLVPGWNVWDNNADTNDVYGHGTAVAG
ncbi:MAG TPA: S8 family serine peptidase, partial [Blastocatellia bacterium]|nr:S8 family serine peptidase [Blastocatellia bacterium]